MIIIPITDLVYRVNPTVFINCSLKELKKEVERVIGEPWTDFDIEEEEKINAYGMVFKVINEKKDSYTILWVKEFEWNIKYLAMLVHESRHLTDEILESRGVKLTDIEATAYYNEFIYSEILKGIKKFEDKKTKKKKKLK